MLWQTRDDLLFNKKSWSVSQVFFVAQVVLTVGEALVLAEAICIPLFCSDHTPWRCSIHCRMERLHFVI
jgi:hypothetical protein